MSPELELALIILIFLSVGFRTGVLVLRGSFEGKLSGLEAQIKCLFEMVDSLKGQLKIKDNQIDVLFAERSKLFSNFDVRQKFQSTVCAGCMLRNGKPREGFGVLCDQCWSQEQSSG